jgi:hypothetical protein
MAGRRPAMAPVASPTRGAVRMVVGLMVVVQSRARLAATTPSRPRLAPMIPPRVPMMAASVAI